MAQKLRELDLAHAQVVRRAAAAGHARAQAEDRTLDLGAAASSAANTCGAAAIAPAASDARAKNSRREIADIRRTPELPWKCASKELASLYAGAAGSVNRLAPCVCY